MTNHAADIRIGTQGWNYDAWVGPFYPLGTRSADFLTVYARAFTTVEVDSPAPVCSSLMVGSMSEWCGFSPAGRGPGPPG